jgi:hypothetical protein
MRNRKLKLSAVIFLSLVLSGLKAQEAIPATGGNASGSGGSSSYSAGQVVYSIYTGTTGSVAEGVHQPYEISTVTAIEDAIGINLSVEAYPNPTTDFLILRVDEIDLLKLSYQLLDLNGKLLQNEKITSRETSIAMGNLVPATYFVKVIHGNKEIKSFKIIKK